MRNAVIYSAALLPVALANPVVEDTLAPRQSVSNPQCNTQGVHVILASGHAPNNPPGIGLFDPTLQAIYSAVPGSDLYSIPYPHVTKNFPEAVETGQGLARDYIASYAAACPNTPLVLAGYSEGGVIIMNALCGESVANEPTTPAFDPKYASHIIATVTYGDETFVPGQSYDYGSCTTEGARAPRQDPGACAAFASNIREYCDAEDPDCCTGHSTAAHLDYQNIYSGDVASFVSSQFSNYKNTHHSSGSSSMSSSSMAPSSTSSSSSNNGGGSVPKPKPQPTSSMMSSAPSMPQSSMSAPAMPQSSSTMVNAPGAIPTNVPSGDKPSGTSPQGSNSSVTMSLPSFTPSGNSASGLQISMSFGVALASVLAVVFFY